VKLLVLDSAMNQTAFLLAELARAGVDTTIAAPRPPDPRGLGRYCREIESPAIDDPRMASFVEGLVRDGGFDRVLPTIEPLQQLAWSLPAELADRVFPSSVEWQRALIDDRRALYRFVSDLGFTVPRDTSIADADSLQHALDLLGLPIVLRGTQGVAGEQVKVCRDLSQAREAYQLLLERSPEPPFAQEYLDGRRCLFGGLFRQGEMLKWFSQTTIEACPAPAGPSVRVRSLRDPALTEQAEAIFKAFKWDGLACAEFIQLAPGDYRFLEINPRPWAAIQAAHYCGMPLLTFFVDYLLGRPVAAGGTFAADVECTLFPAFFTARIRNHQFPRLRDFGAYMQALRAAPWSEPPLLRSFLRLVWWTYEAQRKAIEVVAPR
jgi:hypothetical protein